MHYTHNKPLLRNSIVTVFPGVNLLEVGQQTGQFTVDFSSHGVSHTPYLNRQSLVSFGPGNHCVTLSPVLDTDHGTLTRLDSSSPEIIPVIIVGQSQSCNADDAFSGNGLDGVMVWPDQVVINQSGGVEGQNIEPWVSRQTFTWTINVGPMSVATLIWNDAYALQGLSRVPLKFNLNGLTGVVV